MKTKEYLSAPETYGSHHLPLQSPTFPLFSSLPAELRLQIWSANLPDRIFDFTRIVTVTVNCCIYTTTRSCGGPCSIPWHANTPRPHLALHETSTLAGGCLTIAKPSSSADAQRAEAENAVQAILASLSSTCIESRRIVLEAYPLALRVFQPHTSAKQRLESRILRINPILDVVRLVLPGDIAPCSHKRHRRLIREPLSELKGVLCGLRRVAVGMDGLSLPPSAVGGRWLNLHGRQVFGGMPMVGLVQCLEGIDELYFYDAVKGPGLAIPEAWMRTEEEGSGAGAGARSEMSPAGGWRASEPSELDEMSVEALQRAYPHHSRDWCEQLRTAVKTLREHLQIRFRDEESNVAVQEGERRKGRLVPRFGAWYSEPCRIGCTKCSYWP